MYKRKEHKHKGWQHNLAGYTIATKIQPTKGKGLFSQANEQGKRHGL